MPDRIDALREAAAARHAATVSRAEAALAVLAQGHETVTFRRLAEAARVSRSWVYRQPELRAAVERFVGRRCHGNGRSCCRSRPPSTLSASRSMPTGPRSHECRPRTRWVLRDQLARKLGAARAASVTTRS